MNNNHIEKTAGGLICDNPKCDWEDMQIPVENYLEWVNKACPKCGDNILTEGDLENYNKIDLAVGIINTLSKEQLEEISAMIEKSGINLDSGIFKDAEGLELLSSEGKVKMTVSTHQEIKATKIEKQE